MEKLRRIIKSIALITAVLLEIYVILIHRPLLSTYLTTTDYRYNVTLGPSKNIDVRFNETEFSLLKQLKASSVTLLHLGKAGGGSVKERIENSWKMNFRRCHPKPCKPFADFVLITIRDPIDRFVSAFYWRLVVLCNPDGDSRKIVTGPNRDIVKNCNQLGREEAEMLFHKYRQNISSLAEALCNDEPPPSSSDARQDIHEITHAKYTIENWLGTFDWENRTQDLVPIIQEKGFDLNRQIDIAIMFLNDHFSWEGPAEFARRRYLVRQLDRKNAGEINDVKRHSSVAHDHNRLPMSELGERCLVNYFREDYKILHVMQVRNVCKSRECQDALQSILNRRADLLSLENL